MVVKRIILQSKNESTHETVSATVSPREPIIILFEKQNKKEMKISLKLSSNDTVARSFKRLSHNKKENNRKFVQFL